MQTADIHGIRHCSSGMHSIQAGLPRYGKQKAISSCKMILPLPEQIIQTDQQEGTRALQKIIMRMWEVYRSWGPLER